MKTKILTCFELKVCIVGLELAQKALIFMGQISDEVGLEHKLDNRK